MMEKLALWGATHAAARDAERLAAQKSGPACEQLRGEARRLRERADGLHREICREETGSRRPERRGAPS